MSILSFNWDKHFIYAIIYWFLEISVRLVMYLKWEFFRMSKDSDVQNEYIYVVLLTIADLLGIILVLYIKFSFKTQQSKIKNEKDDFKGKLIYEEQELNKSNNLMLKSIIICVSTYLSRSLY